MSIEHVKDAWAKETLEAASSKIESRDLKGAAEDLTYIVSNLQARALGVFQKDGPRYGSLSSQLAQVEDPGHPPHPDDLRKDASRVPDYLEALARENAEIRDMAAKALFISVVGSEGALEYYTVAQFVKKKFNPRDGSFIYEGDANYLKEHHLHGAYLFALNAVLRIESSFGNISLKPPTGRG